MATDSVLGLFQDPSMYQQQQYNTALDRGVQLAQLDPFQRASAMMYTGGNVLGGAIGSALGAEDPTLKLMSTRQAILKDYDPNTLEGLQGAAKALRDAGDLQGSYALAQKAQAVQAESLKQQLDYRKTAALERKNDIAEQTAQLRHEEMMKRLAAQDSRFAAALAAKTEKPLGINDLKMIDAAQGQFEGAQQVNNEAAKYIKLIDDGKMNFGFTENLGTSYRTMTNSANESDLNKTNFEQFIQNSVNNVLNQAKGTQAKDDAIRAEKQIMSALSRNDNKAVKASLQELQRVMGNVAKDAEGTLRLVGRERKRDLTPQGGANNDPLGIRK